MRERPVIEYVIAVILLSPAWGLAAGAPPAPAPVQVLEEWSGRIQTPLRPALITDAVRFSEAWTLCGMEGGPPAVDFRQHAVIAASVRASGLFVKPTLDDAGDLRLGVSATPDQPPFYSCVLALISRAGIRTVEGGPLEEPASPSGTEAPSP